MKGYKAFSDIELIQLLKQSDHAAYNEIFHRYFDLTYIHACKKLDDKEQAEDVVQEVFAYLWFKRESIPQVNNIAAYLFTSMRNKIFDIFAHEQVKTKHLDSLKEYLISNTTVSTDHRIREKELNAYIEQSIQALPRKMRLVFELSRKEQLSYKEIAEQTSTTENNVSKQINSAIKILRMKLGGLIILLQLLNYLK
jgi:RNA polymerase sigma-70 factor (ECF subfamily)